MIASISAGASGAGFGLMPTCTTWATGARMSSRDSTVRSDSTPFTLRTRKVTLACPSAPATATQCQPTYCSGSTIVSIGAATGVVSVAVDSLIRCMPLPAPPATDGRGAGGGGGGGGRGWGTGTRDADEGGEPKTGAAQDPLDGIAVYLRLLPPQPPATMAIAKVYERGTTKGYQDRNATVRGRRSNEKWALSARPVRPRTA